jgi:hypothetical protein
MNYIFKHSILGIITALMLINPVQAQDRSSIATHLKDSTGYSSVMLNELSDADINEIFDDLCPSVHALISQYGPEQAGHKFADMVLDKTSNMSDREQSAYLDLTLAFVANCF